MSWKFFFVWIVQVALSRLRYRWRSLIAIIIAMLLVTSIGAIIPLYTTAISQVGMIQRLENNPPEDVQILGEATVLEDTAELESAWEQYRAFFRQLVDDRLQHPFPGWVDQTISGLETNALTLETSSAKVHLAYYDHWQDNVDLVEGRLPQQPAEGVLSLVAARSLEIEVGDRVDLSGYGEQLAFTVTGIVTPNKQLEGYWTSPSPLRLEQDISGNYTTVMLLPREDFFATLVQNLPEIRVQFKERVLFDYEQLPFGEIQAAARALQTMAQEFKDRRNDFPLGMTFDNRTDAILLEYHQDTLSLTQSFRILILQVGLLATLFLFVISELVRRSEHAEIAMLQSRGARNRHIIGEQILEVSILGVLTALIAPWIAKLTILLLVPSLGNLKHLPLQISWQSYAYSGIAALIACCILVVTLFPVLKQLLVARGGSQLRGTQLPWWRRYYLDFGLLILAILGLWQFLNLRTGNNGSDEAFTQSDPLLLLTPTFALIALGSILLRFFPPATRLVAYLLATKKSLMPVLAGRQVSREPVHYARIALLLGLAVGLGGFVTSYHSTLVHSQIDQSHYQAGTDIRIVEKNSESETDRIRPLEFYTDHPTVVAASPVLRLDDIDLIQNLYKIGDGNILAVDFDTFSQVAMWRDDLGALQAPYVGSKPVLPERGKTFPSMPEKIGLWTRLESSYFVEDGSTPYTSALTFLVAQNQLRLRVRDGAGTYFTVPLEVKAIDGVTEDALAQALEVYAAYHAIQAFSGIRLNEEERLIIEQSDSLSGWVYWEGDLSGYAIQDSLSLENVYLRYVLPYSFNGRSFSNWQLHIADITLVSDQSQIMSDWMTADAWDLYAINDSVIEKDFFDSSGRAENTPGLNIQWEQAASYNEQTRSFALLLNYPPLPEIPVIASESFLEENNLEVGMDVERFIQQSKFSFHIIASTTYYPTLYNEEEPFLVIDLDTLLYALNRYPTRIVYPSEVWVKLVHKSDLDALLDDLRTAEGPYFVVDEIAMEDLRESYQTDPLSIGLLGLLYFSFGTVLVFSTIMLLTYTALTVRSRQSIFGVLQAFGVSSRQLVMGLAMEQLLVIGFASAVGAILGYALTLFVLPALANSATTSIITPPLIVYVSQSTIIRHVGFMLLVLGVLVVSNLLLIRQLSPAETIKMGDE